MKKATLAVAFFILMSPRGTSRTPPGSTTSGRSCEAWGWTPAQPSFSRAGGPKRLALALRMNRPRIGRRPIHNPRGDAK